MTWLKVKEAARLLDLTDSAIKKAIKKNKYEFRHVEGIGRGGVQIEIALESLPQEVSAMVSTLTAARARASFFFIFSSSNSSCFEAGFLAT